MSLEFLREVAATPLPKPFYASRDIDAIRILRQAGLVLAVIGDPPEGGARVLAVTERGNQELLRFHYPAAKPASRRSTWLELAAQKARDAVKSVSSRQHH